MAGEEGDKSVYTFHKRIRKKVNLITRLKFEHAYPEVVVQHLSHYVPVTYPERSTVKVG